MDQRALHIFPCSRLAILFTIKLGITSSNNLRQRQGLWAGWWTSEGIEVEFDSRRQGEDSSAIIHGTSCCGLITTNSVFQYATWAVLVLRRNSPRALQAESHVITIGLSAIMRKINLTYDNDVFLLTRVDAMHASYCVSKHLIRTAYSQNC
jgi:hypothetical protein